MDILTERGQQSLQDERIAALWVETKWGVRYIETPKSSPATIDAVLTDERAGTIKAVVETKCRYDIDLDGFRDRYRSEWLVTWEKINRGTMIAQALGVPLVGFLYLPADKTLLIARISNPEGTLALPVRLETTETQKTVNGGRAVRTNAFIDMRTAPAHKVL